MNIDGFSFDVIIWPIVPHYSIGSNCANCHSINDLKDRFQEREQSRMDCLLIEGEGSEKSASFFWGMAPLTNAQGIKRKNTPPTIRMHLLGLKEYFKPSIIPYGMLLGKD